MFLFVCEDTVSGDLMESKQRSTDSPGTEEAQAALT